MQIYIQDRSESTVATIGDFYEDMHKTLTSTGTGSYEFTVSKSEPGQEFLNVGNYVVLLDEQNKGHQFTITKVDQLHDEKTVYAEDASLQLLSKEARPWAKVAKAQPASYYFNKALKGTGWVIGVNQIANLTRTLEWTGWDTVLTRLLSIATEFDNAELDFHVELDRTNVVRKVVDIYKQVGAYRDDIQLVYGDTANDIQKTESTENFATAIEGIGSLVENTKEGEPEKHYNFSAIGYDDGDLYSPKGDPKLYSRKAHEKWDGKYGYSERHFEYETKDPQELLNRSKTELKKRCEPEVNYEISIADGRLININKGDTVKIFDHTYNPELLLQARAVEVDKSYTDPSQNKAIFGNFLTLISNVDPRLLEIQKQISQLPKARTPYPWVRYADDDKGTGMSMFPAGKAYMATVWNYETAVPSDNPIDYAGKWIKVKGEDGQDGSNGVPGPKGSDGQTSYFHTAWADDLSGSIGFTTSGGDGKKYIGTYSDLTKADSEDPSKYNWALFKGEDGQDGQDGKSSYTHIAYATSSTGDGFSQTPTATTTYVGMYVDPTATDSTDPSKYKWTLIKGADGSQGTPGKTGADGKTPYLHTAYSWSADGTDRFTTVYPNLNLLKNTRTLSANSTYKWGTLFASSQIYDSTIRSKSGVSAMNFSFDCYVPLDAAVGSQVYIQLKGQNPQATDVGPDDWNTLLGRSDYLIKQSDLGKTIRVTAPVLEDSNYQSFDTALADTVSITIRQGNDIPGFVYSCIKLETSSTATPYTPSPLDDPEGAYPKFIGTYTDYIADDSADPSKYTWAKMRGEQGERGKQIFKSSYENPPNKSGNWWSDLSPAPSVDNPPKIGDTVITPSGNILQIDTVTVGGGGGGGTFGGGDVLGNIKGPSGTDGKPGKDGLGIKSTVIDYQLSSSGTVTPTGTWSTTVPALVKGQYLWTRTTLTYTDNSSEPVYSVSYVAKDGNNGTDGLAGKDGVGITTTTITYQSGTSGTVQPTGTWVSSPPSVPGGQYLWTRTVWTYTDGTTEAGYSVGKIGETGQTGQKGDTGPRGSTGATGAKGTTGPIGPQGPKGDPGSKDVPVTTVSAAQPTTAKNGDIWWVLNSADVATAMKVYTSGAWVDKKVDQSVLNIVTLNAVEINGSTINGSEFNTSYTGTLVDGQQGSSQQTLDKYGYSQTSTIPWWSGPIVTRSEIDNIGRFRAGYSKQSKYNPSHPWDNTEGSIYINPINLYIEFTGMGLSGEYSLSVQDAYQNSGSATYLNGWGSWNADYSLKVVRQGRMVTVWGYIKHNNSATITPFAQVPAWARPQQGILISAVTFNSKVGNPIASALVMNAETGKIGFNSGGQKGGYVCFSTTYVGGYI